MKSATLGWLAAFALVSRASALGMRALTLASQVWMRASTLAALAHTAADGVPVAVLVVAAPAMPAMPKVSAPATAVPAMILRNMVSSLDFGALRCAPTATRRH